MSRKWKKCGRNKAGSPTGKRGHLPQYPRPPWAPNVPCCSQNVNWFLVILVINCKWICSTKIPHQLKWSALKLCLMQQTSWHTENLAGGRFQRRSTGFPILTACERSRIRTVERLQSWSCEDYNTVHWQCHTVSIKCAYNYIDWHTLADVRHPCRFGFQAPPYYVVPSWINLSFLKKKKH